jgi:hypothetical protein
VAISVYIRERNVNKLVSRKSLYQHLFGLFTEVAGSHKKNCVTPNKVVSVTLTTLEVLKGRCSNRRPLFIRLLKRLNSAAL